MEKLKKELQKELNSVEHYFDYYDSSESTKRLIASEKRQIERLIKVVSAIGRLNKNKTNEKS